MFVVDTNILLYAADKSMPEYNVCRRLLETWRSQSSVWYLTWDIVYEFLRVVTHPRVFRNPWNIIDAWSFVQALLASPGLQILAETDRHSKIVQDVFKELPHIRGNLVFDTHTAILMKEHGVDMIYTHDTDFHRFPFVEVIDPLQ
ncbi:MAG: PIN domain-containing protein [Deltaproteobacteria bacterium]|nr:PIN domain-containing protein [Deltaproteobacteria bacterium]